MERDKVNYYLVLEKRLGDYNIIDLSKLDIANNKNISNDIIDIDFFTCNFSEEEIRDSIIRSNMARPEYLDGRLRIVSDAKHKHNLSVLTKDIYTQIMEFQTNSEELGQDLKNKLFGAYKKIVETNFSDPDFIKGMLERFKDALRGGQKIEIFKLIGELPYQKSRGIYISIYKNFNKEIEENKQNRKETIKYQNPKVYRASNNQRILEKLNDNI